MNYKNLLIFSTIGLIGYITLHGHRLGVDCWMCKYRGLAFLGSAVSLGTYLAFTED